MGAAPTREDDETLLEMLRLRDAGNSRAEIAQAAGRSKNSVAGVLWRFDAEAAAQED